MRHLVIVRRSALAVAFVALAMALLAPRAALIKTPAFTVRGFDLLLIAIPLCALVIVFEIVVSRSNRQP